MKYLAIVAAAIAALGLTACGSTVTPTERPVTPTPTVLPTPTATPAPTPTPTPSATPTPASPLLVLVETCDGSANAGTYGSVTFSADTPGFDFVAYGPGLMGGWAGATTADASGNGSVSDLNAGDYEFTNFAPADSPGTPAGSFTIPACSPSVHVTACDRAGTASGGAIAWSAPGYSTLTITGPAPSTYHFTIPASAGRYGPLTAGNYIDRLSGSGASVSGAFTIPACSAPSI